MLLTRGMFGFPLSPLLTCSNAGCQKLPAYKLCNVPAIKRFAPGQLSRREPKVLSTLLCQCSTPASRISRPWVQVSRNVLRQKLRDESLNFRIALASICRILSRLTSNSCPISSRVLVPFPPMPYRILTILCLFGIECEKRPFSLFIEVIS